MARNSKFTRKQIVDSLESTGGFITHAAKVLGCCYETIENYIKRDPSIGVVLAQIKENRLDIAESVIMSAMRDTEEMREAVGAAKFYLKYKGHGRGYLKHSKIEVSEDLSVLMREADERVS